MRKQAAVASVQGITPEAAVRRAVRLQELVDRFLPFIDRVVRPRIESEFSRSAARAPRWRSEALLLSFLSLLHLSFEMIRLRRTTAIGLGGILNSKARLIDKEVRRITLEFVCDWLEFIRIESRRRCGCLDIRSFNTVMTPSWASQRIFDEGTRSKFLSGSEAREILCAVRRSLRHGEILPEEAVMILETDRVI